MSEEVEAEFRATPKEYSTFSFQEGVSYTGEWIKKAVNLGEDDQRTINVREGKGTLKFKDGSVYEGEWLDDKMEGKGKLTFSDGKIYEGSFKNNQFHGHGRYTWPAYTYDENDDEEEEQGEGEGDVNNEVDEDEDESTVLPYYEGDWKENKFHGQGVYLSPDGRKFKGVFVFGNFSSASSYVSTLPPTIDMNEENEFYKANEQKMEDIPQLTT